MSRLLCAIALSFGFVILVSGCGSGSSSTPATTTASCSTGQVLYNTNGNNSCVQACGNMVNQGYVNGQCLTVNNGTGTGAYGSCTTCTTPNGQSGVYVTVGGSQMCGLAVGTTSNMGMVYNQMYPCSGAYGTNGIGGYGTGYAGGGYYVPPTTVYYTPGYGGGGGWNNGGWNNGNGGWNNGGYAPWIANRHH